MSDSQLTAVIGNGQYDMFMWGWGVEPNPDFQLSVFTCGQRSYGSGPNYSPGWSDSFYCNSTYDKLYHQRQALDGGSQAKVVRQMQKMLYDDDVRGALLPERRAGLPRRQVHRVRPSPNKPNGLYLYQEIRMVEPPLHQASGQQPVAD